MKTLYLQISAAQGPAECQQAVSGVLKRLEQAAKQAQLQTVIKEENHGKHGILSAVIKITGDNPAAFARDWCGTIQWICESNIRPTHRRKNWFIGIFRLPEREKISLTPENIAVQTCKASGKGGQHVNKTNSAVRVVDQDFGFQIKVKAERSQHRNKALALQKISEARAEIAKAREIEREETRHKQHWQVERGNPVKVFLGRNFREKT